jgi:protein-tyrosine-phosphatase
MRFKTFLTRSMPPAVTPLNVLFLCTHNSARSILAEALLNHLGRGRFKAYSAGSSPRAQQKPHPLALETLAWAGISTEGLSSKSWDAFSHSDAPRMDLVITVCDSAAAEACPIWPGHPATAHWGQVDPSAGDGPDEQKRRAFEQTLQHMQRHLAVFVQLPDEMLQPAKIQAAARAWARGE